MFETIIASVHVTFTMSRCSLTWAAPPPLFLIWAQSKQRNVFLCYRLQEQQTVSRLQSRLFVQHCRADQHRSSRGPPGRQRGPPGPRIASEQPCWFQSRCWNQQHPGAALNVTERGTHIPQKDKLTRLFFPPEVWVQFLQTGADIFLIAFCFRYDNWGPLCISVNKSC